MNSMDKCCNNKNGGCYLTDESGSTSFARECPFSKQAQKHCELYAPASFCKGASKVSSMEKRAAWADVAAKARAIVASGGVNLIEENASEIEAVVTSYQVASEFPVYMGGPYDVILSKRSWTNQENVGGWIQGYLCSCEWGHYNSGEPGPRWQGRFCAHAYATLLVANARARNEFTRNRMASMFVMGECCECGGYKDVSVTTGMCQECQDTALFDAVVAAYQNKASAEHEALIQAVAEEELDEVCEEMEVTPIDEKTSMLTWGDHKAVVTSSVYPVRYTTPGDDWSDYEYTVMVEADSPEEAMNKVKAEYGVGHCEVSSGDGVYDSFEDYDAKKPHNNRGRLSSAKPIDAVDCDATKEAISEDEQWELDNEMWEMEGSNKTAYEYGSYDEGSRYYCGEGELDGEYSLEEMKAFYEETVDKGEYPAFSDWEWDAVRSGYMSRIATFVDPDGWSHEEFGDWEVLIKETSGGDEGAFYGFVSSPKTDMNKYIYGDTYDEVLQKCVDYYGLDGKVAYEEGPWTHKIKTDAVDWAEQCAAALKEYKSAGRRKPPSKDDFEFDFWGSMEQMVCTKGSYKYEMSSGPKGWGWCIRNKSNETIVDESEWNENYSTWEEAYDAMVQQSRVFARRTAGNSMECLFEYKSMTDSQYPYPETYYSPGLGDTVEECLEDCMNSVQRVDPDAHDFKFVEELHIPELTFASKVAGFAKDATRHFTYAEMQELEDEIVGRELHNTDRFKA